MKTKSFSSSQNFKFISKSEVLKYLQNKIHLSKIELIYDFTVREWNNNQKNIISSISKKFDSTIIIRSSALGEDSSESSQAGNFESILNVNPKSSHSIKKAVSSVIQSYKKTGFENEQNQILVQNQSKNIFLSGVVFSRESEFASPYYLINYDESKSTVSVTAGSAGNIIKIFRDTDQKLIPHPWRLLLKSIKEIESILKLDKLDIEFGINKKNQVIIFQVRPITFILKTNTISTDKKIKKLIFKNKNFFSKLSSSKLYGKQTFYSDMSDWNPAEIIGNNPHPFDYSLYDFLIMKNAWSKGRKNIGYHDVKSTPLMIKFGNKPYVDIRASFNSFLPKKLPTSIKKKLLKFYLKKLKELPHLHDKVEFEILFSCYDLTLNSRLKELKNSNFSSKEINLLKSILLEFTNNIIQNFNEILDHSNKSILIMTNKRNDILSNLKNNSSHKEMLDAASKLLNDCKTYGTIPFSTMARIAFISTILLKSAQNTGVISQQFVDSFLNSISTPLSEIQNDLHDYKTQKITKYDFLKKYGHLRPGTYDITANRYDTQDHFLDDIKMFVTKKKFKKRPKSKNLKHLFKKHNLNFDSIDFFDFTELSLVSREQLKFEFTKNLSAAIELIINAGSKLGFSKYEMAYLKISNILKAKNYSNNLTRKLWKKLISKELVQKQINDMLVLPPLIFSNVDFEIISYFISKPNFITNKKITSSLFDIENNSNVIDQIENNIILIEHADPGYDWIFTKHPSALITKYGGVASHMAIRCAEMGLPAVIGCGEILYEQLKSSSTVMIDCKNNEVMILENSEKNEEIEARKVLKSLGYIK